MKYSEYKYLIFSDLFRITRNNKSSTLIYNILFNPEYKYIFWMRTNKYTKLNLLLKYIAYPVTRLILRHLRFKYSISISPNTNIGCGFNINHFGNIVINPKSIIGKNCTISQGVTLGQKNRGKYKGYPILGDNIYIGPGVKIIGSVKIDNNVAIGANSVVTKNIPANSVVIGIPGKVISQNGSLEYVNNTDYDKIWFNN